MAQNPDESAIIGTVTAIVGEVKVTGTDGVERILAAGDKVSAGEVIETSATGAVHIQLANGRALECGPRFSGTLNPGLLDLASGTRIALDGSIINPAVAAAPAPGDSVVAAPAAPAITSTATSPDIAALQAAIAGGADPSRIAAASAAGGAAPGAGGADGGGGTPLLIEQANSHGQVTSGIDGSGGQPLGFPDLTTQEIVTLQPESPPANPPPPTPPVISVDLTGIRLVPPSDSDPEAPQENVTVSGNIVSLVEGTSPGADPGKILNFVLVLDKASDVDVEVTYTITALGEENDIDLVDLLGGTVIVPAGVTQILVPIKIAQDHSVETNESFELVITSATNATVNPNASTAILNIINDDEPPLAHDDAYTVNEGESGTTLLPSVLARTDSGESVDDSGADVGEILTVTSTGTITTTQGGQVQMNADGTFHYFAPNAEFNGTDSFSYTMTDGFNGESEAVVTITVAAVNDLPDAVGNAYSVNEDSTLVFTAPGILGNDTTGGDGGVLAVTNYTQPTHGTLTLDENGGFVYTPAANYNGPDSFTYTIKDADGDTDTATVSITVNPVNDVPNAADNAYSVNEDSVLTIALPGVLAGDTTGGDGGVLAVTSYTQPAHGTLTLDATGGFVYTPAANYNGPDSFTYTIEDADGDTDTATVAITVNPVNDVPDAVGNSYSVNEDSTLVLTAPGILGNDSVGGDGGTLAVTSFTQPAHGTLALNPGGSFTYTPATNYNGPDSFTYTIEDADGDTDTATVSLTINPVNDVPDALDNAYSVNEDTALTITAPGLLGDDTTGGDGGTLAVTSFTQPAHGTLTLNPDGSFTYTPATNYNGPDSFTYTIQDADGDTDTATVSLTINPVNDVPDALDNAYSVNEDTALTITAPGLLGDDTTGGDGGTLAVTSFTQPAHGTLTLNSDGSFTYTPAANYNGPDSFTYTIQDTDGDADTATVSITVNPVNDVPDAVGNSYSVNEDSTLVLTAPGILGNDTTGGDGGTLAVTSFTQPSHGSLTLNSDGSFTYTPAANYNGPDSFTYTIEDDDGDADTATVAITVNPADDFPSTEIPAAGGATTTVYEAGLPARGVEAAGSNSSAHTETVTGTVTFISHDGVSQVSLGDHTLTGAAQTFSDGLTASYTYDTSTGAGTISYSYTLPDNTSGDNTSASFPVVVTDPDGDSAPAGNLVINIIDDNPAIQSIANLALQNNAGVYTGSWIPVTGADGYNASITGTNTSSPEGVNITLTNPPSLVQASSNEDKFDGADNYVGELYTAYFDSAKTQVFFTLLMKVDGTYVFDLVEPNPTITTTETLNLTGSVGGFGDFLYAEKIADAKNYPDPKTDVKFTAHQDYAGGTNLGALSNVNTSNNGIGVSDSGSGGGIHTALNESLTLVFLKGDADADGDTHPADSAVQPVDSVTVSFLVAHDNGKESVNDEVSVKFILHLEDGSVEIQNVPGSGIADEQSYTVASASGKKLLSVDVINVDTDGDTFLLTAADVTVTTTQLPSDLGLNFTAQIVDGDGDVSATAAFTVAIDTNNSMSSTPGNTDDIMYGDTVASDTFVWHAGDTGEDTVVNFTAGPAQNLNGTGDILDLADVLQGENANAASLVSFLSFSSNGSDTTISIDADGALNGQSTAQTIVLKGVDLTVGGTMDATAIINQLLADHNLKTS